MDDYKKLNKFDKAVGGLLDGNNLRTKPTTIEVVEKWTGEAETFIVQTVRDEDGDSIIVKFVDNEGVKRLILWPKVADAIVRHRDALTSRARRNKSRQAARDRMSRGELPGFMRKKKQA
jgi:hypothetical protein